MQQFEEIDLFNILIRQPRLHDLFDCALRDDADGLGFLGLAGAVDTTVTLQPVLQIVRRARPDSGSALRKRDAVRRRGAPE